MTLLALQQALVECVAAEDPTAVLEAKRFDPGLPAQARAFLARIDEDGLRLTGMLVTKLRLERVLRGDAALRAWSEREPEAFAAAFARYRRAGTPAAVFPAEEAAAFRAFLAAETRERVSARRTPAPRRR